MAGLRGNQATFAFQSQGTVKTPVTALTAPVNTASPAKGGFKAPLSGGGIGPVKATDQLAETDANRDQGVTFARSAGVEGTPELLVRDGALGALLFAALGADTPTGATPNWIHSIKPANTLPYLTCFLNIADTLRERYDNCLVSSLTVRAGAGDPLSAAVALNGLGATRLTADPTGWSTLLLEGSTGTAARDYVYNFNDAIVTMFGGATALVSSFELTIDNNVTRQQTDDFAAYDVIAGQRQVTLGFDLIFETITEYNDFFYYSGTPGAPGTTLSNKIRQTSAVFQFDNGANNQVKFTLPTIALEEYPREINVGGDPIVSSIRAVGQRPPTGTDIITADLKNQIGLYT